MCQMHFLRSRNRPAGTYPRQGFFVDENLWSLCWLIFFPWNMWSWLCSEIRIVGSRGTKLNVGVGKIFEGAWNLGGGYPKPCWKMLRKINTKANLLGFSSADNWIFDENIWKTRIDKTKNLKECHQQIIKNRACPDVWLLPDSPTW